MLRRWDFLVAGIMQILAGSFLAHAIQTASGVSLREVRFAGADH